MDGKTNEKDKQPTLKVMRLYKPKFHLDTMFPTERNMAFALSNSLLLPDSFGNIYLGETFCSYISVINHFPYTLYNVGLSARIQMANSRTELFDKRSERCSSQSSQENPVPVFTAGSNLDTVVEHPLTEIGVHTLRVGVSYSHDVSQQPAQSLRKFYRFNVTSPISFTFQHYTLQDVPYVEASLTNVTQMSFCIKEITFEALAPYNAVSASSSSKTTLLGPDECIQRVFRFNSNTTASNNTLGKVKVTWQTAMGETGTLFSNHVMKKAESAKQQYCITIVNGPSTTSDNDTTTVKIGVPFVLTLKVVKPVAIVLSSPKTQNAPCSIQLQFRRDGMKGIFVTSRANIPLTRESDLEFQEISVEFLPLLAGLFDIRGAFVVDFSNGTEYALEPVGSLLVVE